MRGIFGVNMLIFYSVVTINSMVYMHQCKQGFVCGVVAWHCSCITLLLQGVQTRAPTCMAAANYDYISIKGAVRVRTGQWIDVKALRKR